jgi:hypothetical protein
MPNWSDQALGMGVPPATPHAIFANGHPISSLTVGADQIPVAGTVYYAPVFVPYRKTIVSLGYLIGSVGGTDKAIAGLYNAEGKLLAQTANAGATVGTASTIQEMAIALVGGVAGTLIEVEGPGFYYVSISLNGTTARLRVTVSGGTRGGSATGAFGTLAAITPPSAAAAAIIAYVL